MVPIVDLFAGPGGLSEGFEGYKKNGKKQFHAILSIEKDEYAYRTLLLRTFLRQFSRPPKEYYARLKGEISSNELFGKYRKQYLAASQIAVQLSLSRRNSRRVKKLVRKALDGEKDKWILIGGPPCQAYSLVGRSRMRAKTSRKFKNDGRHFLYQEYLRILKTFKPPVFIMENVKGILSSSPKNRIEIFERILKDFSEAGYTVHSLVKRDTRETIKPIEYVIESEQFGIPQARHRVFLLGVRKDLSRGSKILRKSNRPVTIQSAIGDLPRIRSHVSPPSRDSYEAWESELRKLKSVFSKDGQLRGFGRAKRILKRLEGGAAFVPTRSPKATRGIWLRKHSDWFIDCRIKGITLHQGRHHMPTDLRRYLFASHYARINGKSPTLTNFSRWLLPRHGNVKEAINGGLFSDRFRVQIKGRPSTTVVSHISKDGHYYIHYDPTQCRSLTVREAARLQTFPDNYYFEGPRTAQYHQVGNAVPPLLARQIAAVVYEILEEN